MSSRNAFVTWIALCLSACSDESDSRIEVIPGTSIQITEGIPDRHTALRFEDKKAEDFHVSESPRLVAHEMDTTDGVVLELTANCSAVAEGGGPVLEELVVSVPSSDVAPVVITVEIEPNADGLCAVAVVGWAGPCIPKPNPIPDHITLDTDGVDQQVCVEVFVPESLPTLDTHFSNLGFLQPLEITGADMIKLVPGTNTGELHVSNVNETFRGERDLEVTWSGGSHALRIVAGAPGDGVLRQRGGPMPVNEYDKVDVLVGSSYYAKTGTAACVRATPRNPSAALVLRTETLLVAQGDLACNGIVNTIEVVTTLDSQPQELVDVELLRCEGCAGDAEQITACCRLAEVEQLDTSVITVRSRSVTESIPVANQGARACVDIESDGVPEIIVSDNGGARIHRAAASTLPPGSPDLRFSEVETVIEKPTTMFSVSWWDGTVARPTVIGDFPTAPELRQLNPTGWEDQAWIQRPPLSARPSREWLPLEPVRGQGASYLVVQQSDYVISFECLSSTTCIDGPPIDVRDLGGSTVDLNQKAYGIGIADFDGDGDLDLLVVIDAFGGTGSARPLTVYGYDLYWNQHKLVGYKPAEIFNAATTPIPWQTLQFVALAQSAKPDIVYVLAKGSAIQHAVIEIAPCLGTGCPMTNILDTIGRPFEIANVGGRLLTSTDLGIWELSALHWIQRDPERARTQQTTFPVPDPLSIYGRSLRTCIVGGTAPAASMLFDADSTVRWTLANVPVETLPASED